VFDSNTSLRTFLPWVLSQGLVAFVLTPVSLFGAGEAVDVLGVSQRLQRDFATEKAKQNQAIFTNEQDLLKQFGGKDGLLPPGAGLTLTDPEPDSIGAEGLKLDLSTQPVGDSMKESAEQMVLRYRKEYQSLKSLLVELAPRFDSLDEAQRKQMEAGLKDFVVRIKTLEALGDKFPSLVERKGFAQDRADLSLKLPNSAKSILRALNPSEDTGFIDQVRQLNEESRKVQVDTGRDSADDLPSTTQTQLSSPTSQVALSPIEAVRDACSTIIGGKDGGPALFSHLSSGPCSQALAKNPGLQSEFQIEKVKKLLKNWQGFGVRSANLKIGIYALARLGIQIWPGHSQSQVPDLPVAKAVEIQQEQKFLSVPDSQGIRPSSESRSSSLLKDKAIINPSRFTD
jgi:hypothetical protein